MYTHVICVKQLDDTFSHFTPVSLPAQLGYWKASVKFERVWT